MLTQQTLEKLYTMKLNGMADAFQQQQQDTDIASLSFEERCGMLVDQQWTWKENRALVKGDDTHFHGRQVASRVIHLESAF